MLPSRSTKMPCGNAKIPAPKLLRSLPVGSKCRIGSSVELAQLFAPQRSATHTLWPSLSISTALVAPQTRPSGSFAQPSMVRYGFGGSPISCGMSSAAVRHRAARTNRDMARNYTRRMARMLVAVGLAVALSGMAVAQDFGFRGFGFRGRFQVYPNTPYDGRFTFVR